MTTSDVIAIDFGNLYSKVAIFKNGTEEILAYSDGHRTLPTMVTFDEASILFGHEAKQQQGRNLKYTINELKRLLLDQTLTEESIQTLTKQLPFDLCLTKDNRLAIKTSHKGKTETIPFEDVVGIFFKKLKEVAEQNLGNEVTKVLISVPPNLTAHQKSALIKAAEKASLRVLKLVSDPICAAIAYQFDCPDDAASHKTILIVDFGSDLDISIVSSDNGFLSVIRHDTVHISGDDLDNSLVNYCIEEFHKRNKNDFSNIQLSQRVLHKLKMSCENAKRVLSQRNEASVEVDSMYEGRDFFLQLTRARWEILNESHLRKINEHLQQILSDTKLLEDTSFSAIICAGSGCKISKVKTILETISQTSNRKIPILDSIDPETVVVRGLFIEASQIAATLSESEDFTQLTTPLQLPCEISVTSFTIGFENALGKFVSVIPKGTPLPVKKTLTTKLKDQTQTSVAIKIYEGEERGDVQKNRLLGILVLKGLATEDKYPKSVEITFTITMQGNLNVRATEIGISSSTHPPQTSELNCDINNAKLPLNTVE